MTSGIICTFYCRFKMSRMVGSATAHPPQQPGSGTSLVRKLKQYLARGSTTRSPPTASISAGAAVLSSPAACPSHNPFTNQENFRADKNNNFVRDKFDREEVGRSLQIAAKPATTSAHHPGKPANLPPTSRRRGPPGKCGICSFRQDSNQRKMPVYHRHHSSKEVRRIAGCKDEADGFFCPTCRFCTGQCFTPGKFHDMSEEKRLRIVLSSSTLHDFWIEGYEGDLVHVDWSTSPGATIQDLLLMWRADYWGETKPMDVLVIGGLNNLLRGENEDRFISRLDDFYNAVVAQGEKRGHRNKNTFAVATLFYPPILCWFEKNGRIPHKEYTNNIEMMTRLNDRIMRMNQRIFTEQKAIYVEENDGMTAGDFSRAPKFHTFGVRNRKHRMEWYRERNPSKKLHLTDRHRSTLGRAAGTYFQKMFTPAFA